MKFKALFLVAALLSTLSFANIAGAQPVPVTPAAPLHLRGERGSARNLIIVCRHLEKAIDALQHDQRDYNGNREKAIDAMQSARADIVAALAWDASHPGQ
jgi:hypothetical protein